MPSTSIYGITYPASTDLVANGYAQMQTLAGNVETVLQAQTQSLSTGYRNTIENPTYSQLQRPTITTTVADFWDYYVDAIAGAAFTRNTIGPTTGLPEWVTGSLTTNVTTSSGAGRYVAVQQKIADVRTLSASTVVVSFYAKATTGTPKVGVNFTQYFGTGGAPSADVVVNGQAVTVSTSWARYSLTFTLASVIGKTLGTNNDSSTILRLWHSAGSTFATQAGSIGNQTANIDVTGVQVERTYLTPLEVRPINQNWFASSTFGVFDSWTPQIKQGASGMTTTVTYAGYTVIGKFCFAHTTVVAGAAGTAANAIQILSNGTLPAPRQYNGVSGHVLIDDIGTGLKWYAARPITGAGTAPAWQFYENAATGVATTPTLAANDQLYLQTWYEIA